jgi:hypothetical protein
MRARIARRQARSPSRSTFRPRSPTAWRAARSGLRSLRYKASFQEGKERFLSNGRMLAALDEPALIRVLRCWKQNGTAYMAMPLYEGQTLGEVLRASPRPSEAWLKSMLGPLLDALATLHRFDCYPCNVTPDNVVILQDGTPLLFAFGAGRRTTPSSSADLRHDLNPGFAPIEQYAHDPTMPEGPWTDVYAVAALIRYAITGKHLPALAARMAADTLPSLREPDAEYSPTFLDAIDRGVAVLPRDRPQTIAEFRRKLGIHQLGSAWGGDCALGGAAGRGWAPPPEDEGISGTESGVGDRSAGGHRGTHRRSRHDRLAPIALGSGHDGARWHIAACDAELAGRPALEARSPGVRRGSVRTGSSGLDRHRASSGGAGDGGSDRLRCGRQRATVERRCHDARCCHGDRAMVVARPSFAGNGLAGVQSVDCGAGAAGACRTDPCDGHVGAEPSDAGGRTRSACSANRQDPADDKALGRSRRRRQIEGREPSAERALHSGRSSSDPDPQRRLRGLRQRARHQSRQQGEIAYSFKAP